MLVEPLASPRSVNEPPVVRLSGPAGYWTRLLPALTALACVTRIPSFRPRLWNPCEGCLAVQARPLTSGGALYETVVDRKPPLVPWLYEGTFAVLGAALATDPGGFLFWTVTGSGAYASFADSSSAVEVLLGFHFFGHYFLQLTPPIALLATAARQILPREGLVTALFTSTCCCTLVLTWGLRCCTHA
jgi:hypothetical protein